MRDSMYDDTVARVSLAPAVRTATAAGDAVDTRGNENFFRQAMVLVTAGTITDGTHTVVVEESDDNAAWTAVPAAHTQGGPLPALAAADSGTVHRLAVDQITKRYLRARVTVGGTPATGGALSVVVLLRGTSGNRPVS